MIIENSGLVGLKSDLAHLDEASTSLGFVREQWEYYRATYDLKIEDVKNKADYYVRFNTRAESGRLEQPHAVLNIESVYMGRATFPHGLDYQTPIPQHILHVANNKLDQLKRLLPEA